MLTRRALLVAGGAVGLTAVVGVGSQQPGVRRRVLEVVDPEPGAPAPGSASGSRVSGSFHSAARGRDLAWVVAYPPGHRVGDRLPVTLVLHARGGDEQSAYADLHLDRYLADVTRAGTPAFALASVDGGEHSYWHRRADGDDPQAMLLTELLPLLAKQGLRTAQVGVFGWSMGGYGALLLAEAAPERVAAVAADSPALWQHAGDTAPGAFDDSADFAAHDVFTGRPRLAGLPVRVACGSRDPFYSATRQFVRGVPKLAGTDFSTGEHTNTFWRRTAPAQLRFLGAALAAVR